MNMCLWLQYLLRTDVKGVFSVSCNWLSGLVMSSCHVCINFFLILIVCSPSSFSSVVDTSLMADESKDILSLKALQGILFAAAAANDRECIETIFSTSAGEAVFQTYRNSSILPENTARAMGHKDLAEYLQNIHKRC